MSKMANQSDQAPADKSSSQPSAPQQASPQSDLSSAQQASGRPALHTILDQLAQLQHDIRRAAQAGAQLAGVAPASFLLPLLRDDNPMVRFAAVEALRLGDFQFNKPIIDTLLSKIDDRQGYIATAAIKALGRKRVTEADEELVSCVGMDDTRIASAALLALCEIGTAPIEEYVEEFLDADQPYLIRAAAMVVARAEMSQFAERIVQLIEELRDDAEIPPQTNKVNPYLVAVRALITALDALQYREAIPLLKDLGLNQIGLRSLSLRTLHNMDVDIIEMACQAHEMFPSANITRLLSEISDDFDGDDQAVAKLNQQLSANRDRLEELADDFVEGKTTRGKATRVAHTYAIIQIDQGMSAYIPAAEYRWPPTKDLLRFRDDLFREDEYQVLSIDRQRGRIKLSRRNLHPDPLVAFQSRLEPDQAIQGTVEGIIHYGVFVQLQPEIVGLVHISRLNLLQDQSPQDIFRIGDQINVIVDEIDLGRRRIRLDLPGTAET